MTTNQTIDGVPRELLEQLVDPVNYIGRVRARAELRALLDAPTELGEIDLTPKRLAHAESVIEKQNNLIASLRAELVESYRVSAQPQGEPVAELQVAFFEHGPVATINWFTPSAFEHGAAKLYTAQPAPLAVVVPDRKPAEWRGMSATFATGWNACLTEVTRLNKSQS